MNKKECLTKDFERRLFRLENAIIDYRLTGKIGGLFPAIFSVMSKCYCEYPVKKV